MEDCPAASFWTVIALFWIALYAVGSGAAAVEVEWMLRWL